MPPWTVWQSTQIGDQHYRESVQECADSIRNAMVIEGIDAETQDRVLGRLGVDFGPPAPGSETPFAPLPSAHARMPEDQQVAQRRFEAQYYGPPPSFDPDCELCQTDMHRCPGCGEPIEHGKASCMPCTRYV